MHEQADAGDDEQHYDGELIDLKRKVRAKRASHHPCEVAMDYGDLVCRKLRELAHRFADANERQGYRADGRGINSGFRPTLADRRADEAVDRRTEQRQQHDDPKMIEYWH